MANTNGSETKSSSGFHSIDLTNPDINQSVAAIKQACFDAEIFYVINHGVSEELTNEVFTQMKKLFGLPLNDKIKLQWDQNFRGYLPPVQGVSYHDQKGFGELYYVGVKEPGDDSEAKKRFYAPNVWPSVDVLPGWKETIQRYLQDLLVVGRAVARLIALALDLSADFFDQPEILGGPTVTFSSMHHYTVQVPDQSNENLGLAPHTDFSLFTLLATDGVSGLQICKDQNAKFQLWENVPPLKGAFIVNTGDMLERLSNGVFRSTLHRVLHRQERYSIGLFLCPSHDHVIECLPTCTSENHPPRYPPIKCQEIISSRFNQKPTAGEGKNN